VIGFLAGGGLMLLAGSFLIYLGARRSFPAETDQGRRPGDDRR
jgi:hypothetical protein